MLGLMGILLMTGSGCLIGETFVSHLKDRELQLSELYELLERFGIYLSSDALSTEELFERIFSEKGHYSSLFRSEHTDITKRAAERIRSSNLAMSESFADYIADFGCTDLDGQMAKNEMLKREVGAEYRNACEKRRRYSRIYRAAGLSVGLMAALMII